jgi:hypothetical protein
MLDKRLQLQEVGVLGLNDVCYVGLMFRGLLPMK